MDAKLWSIAGLSLAAIGSALLAGDLIWRKKVEPPFIELRETIIAMCKTGAAPEPTRTEEFRRLQMRAAAGALETIARASHEAGVGFRLRLAGRLGLLAIFVGTLFQIWGVVS